MTHSRPWTDWEFCRAYDLRYDHNWSWEKIGETLERPANQVKQRLGAYAGTSSAAIKQVARPRHVTTPYEINRELWAKQQNDAFVAAMRKHYPASEIPNFETPKLAVSRAMQLQRKWR